MRILDIDTPGTHEPDLEAKECLARLERVEAGLIERDGRDRQGRTLATLSIGGRGIGVVLSPEGLALPYWPGSGMGAGRGRG